MKKRILSLLLAFSMAATLAPATALVNPNVAEAAIDSLVFHKDSAAGAVITEFSLGTETKSFYVTGTNAIGTETVDLSWDGGVAPTGVTAQFSGGGVTTTISTGVEVQITADTTAEAGTYTLIVNEGGQGEKSIGITVVKPIAPVVNITRGVGTAVADGSTLEIQRGSQLTLSEAIDAAWIATGRAGGSQNVTVTASLAGATTSTITAPAAKTFTGGTYAETPNLVIVVPKTEALSDPDGDGDITLSLKAEYSTSTDTLNYATKTYTVKLKVVERELTIVAPTSVVFPSKATADAGDRSISVNFASTDITGAVRNGIALNDYRVVVACTSAPGGKTAVLPGSSNTLALTPDGSAQTINTTYPAGVNGEFTFSWRVYYTGGTAVNGDSVLVNSGNYSVIIGETVKITLDPKGGEINDAMFVKQSDGKYVGYFPANSNWFIDNDSNGNLDNNDEFLPNAEKADAWFAGWTNTATGLAAVYNPGFPAERTLSYVADWDEDRLPFAITLDSNGAGEAAKTIGRRDRKIGDALVSSNQFSRTGYTLAGWSTRADATVKLYDIKEKITVDMIKSIQAAGGTTLYAVWTPNTYKITFDSALPAKQSLSEYSGKSMEPIDWTFGTSVTNARWAAMTRNVFHVKGYTFVGWSATLGSANSGGDASKLVLDITNLASGDYAGNDGLITDADLQTTGTTSTIELHATWVPGDSYVIFEDETGNKAYETYASGVSQSGTPSDSVPAKSGKVGYFVESWTGSDGKEFEVGDTNVYGSVALTPKFREEGIDYNVYFAKTTATDTTKLRVGREVQTSEHLNTFVVEQKEYILPTRTASTATLAGWKAWIAANPTMTSINGKNYTVDTVVISDDDLDAAGFVALPGTYTKSFNTADMISAMYDEFGDDWEEGRTNYATNTSDYTVFFQPVWKMNTVRGGLVETEIVVPYGTSLASIEGAVRPRLYVNYQDNEVALPDRFGVASVKLSGTYDPLKATRYTLKVTITPRDNVNTKSAVYTTDLYVRVLSKDASQFGNVSGVVATNLQGFANVALPNRVTVADVKAALSKLNTVVVTGDNGTKYNLSLADVDNDWTPVAGALDTNTYITAEANGDDTRLRGAASYRFSLSVRTALKDNDECGVTAHESGHLDYLATAGGIAVNGNTTISVIVNLGAGTIPVVKPAIDGADEVEKIDSVTTSEAQVHALLDSNYMLRFRNKVTGAHLYTADFTEYVALMVNKNWEHETYISGSNTFKASSKKTSVYTTPVYRLFSSANKEHLYTKDFGEVQSLVAGGKWTLDNSTIYVSMDEAGTAYYRQVRNVPVGGGKSVLQHNWAPKAEYDANLANGKGWRADFDGKPVWYSPAN